MKKIVTFLIISINLFCTLTKTYSNNSFKTLDELKISNKYSYLDTIIRRMYPIGSIINISVSDNGQIKMQNRCMDFLSGYMRTTNVSNLPRNLVRKTNYSDLTKFEKDILNYYKFSNDKEVTIVGILNYFEPRLSMVNGSNYIGINGSISVNGKIQDTLWQKLSPTDQFNYVLLDGKDQIALAAINNDNKIITYTYLKK